MFLVDPADVLAVHRANTLNGRDGGLAEVRRRWPAVAERALPGVLDRVLKLKVDASAEAMTCDARAIAGDGGGMVMDFAGRSGKAS